jgi:hypothetical protein
MSKLFAPAAAEIAAFKAMRRRVTSPHMAMIDGQLTGLAGCNASAGCAKAGNCLRADAQLALRVAPMAQGQTHCPSFIRRESSVYRVGFNAQPSDIDGAPGWYWTEDDGTTRGPFQSEDDAQHSEAMHRRGE